MKKIDVFLVIAMYWASGVMSAYSYHGGQRLLFGSPWELVVLAVLNFVGASCMLWSLLRRSQ